MYPAKILLFGEYSLLCGSKALAVPFRNYFGKWSKSEYCAEFTHVLVKFANYLEDAEEVPFSMDIQKFRKDIASGLYFESSVPISYGVGSSGALCAAFYGNYVNNPIPHDCPDNQLPDLKKHLSFLESYFHGSSSGMDPMVSYTNAALFFDGKGTIKRISMAGEIWEKISVFLIDTKRHGNTGANIKLFNEMLHENYYAREIQTNYNKLVNRCIDDFMEHKATDFVSSVNKLSHKQQSLFEPMILSEYLKYFHIDGDTSKFALKLCGSGGGGFLLGFTSDLEYVNKQFTAEGLKVIPVKPNEYRK
ncbi:MAG TPA: hypothetical protein VIH57_18615 [Bacteroidales bacterium]